MYIRICIEHIQPSHMLYNRLHICSKELKFQVSPHSTHHLNLVSHPLLLNPNTGNINIHVLYDTVHVLYVHCEYIHLYYNIHITHSVRPTTKKISLNQQSLCVGYSRVSLTRSKALLHSETISAGMRSDP